MLLNQILPITPYTLWSVRMQWAILFLIRGATRSEIKMASQVTEQVEEEAADLQFPKGNV
jgi:hypothetical protein